MKGGAKNLRGGNDGGMEFVDTNPNPEDPAGIKNNENVLIPPIDTKKKQKNYKKAVQSRKPKKIKPTKSNTNKKKTFFERLWFFW